MSIDQNKTDLQDALQKPVITNPQMEKIMAQSTASETKSISPRWYVSLLRTTIVTLGALIGGIALGFIFVVIIHYTGLEAWMDSMRSY
jgi:Flp pilus assembly protein TadB